MTSPFRVWLKRLEGYHDISIATQVNKDLHTYRGTICVIEKELCLFKEHNKMTLFRINDIISISGTEGIFDTKVASKKINKNPFSRWLKNLIGREKIEIVTYIGPESYNFEGKIIAVDDQLCTFHCTWKSKDHLFRIDDVVEISGKEPLFDLKAEVEIEEIKE